MSIRASGCNTDYGKINNQYLILLLRFDFNKNKHKEMILITHKPY